MRYLALLTASLPILATASPLKPRAGGPAFIPIPANCTVINSLPNTTRTTTSCTSANLPSGYMLPTNFTATHEVFAEYFPQPSVTPSQQAVKCQQQCYGYGTKGTCKAALLAYGVRTPKGYLGTEGGVPMTACLMYDVHVDSTMFVASPEGQFVNETMGNIYCPG